MEQSKFIQGMEKYYKNKLGINPQPAANSAKYISSPFSENYFTKKEQQPAQPAQPTPSAENKRYISSPYQENYFQKQQPQKKTISKPTPTIATPQKKRLAPARLTADEFVNAFARYIDNMKPQTQPTPSPAPISQPQTIIKRIATPQQQPKKPNYWKILQKIINNPLVKTGAGIILGGK